MGPATSSQFVPGVHAARALAIWLVLAAHIVGLWTNAEGFRWWAWQLYLGGINLLRFDHQAGGHVGLLLFFLLSGFIVSQAASGEGRPTFAKRRLARLLPAMILAVALAVLVLAVDLRMGWPTAPGVDGSRAFSPWIVFEATGLGVTMGGLSALFVLWSLNVEYYWYTLLWALLPQAARRPVLATWAMAAAVLLLVPVAWALDGPGGIEADHLPYVFVILVGRWIFLARQGTLSRPRAALAALVMAALYGLTLWPTAGHDIYAGAHPRFLSLAWAILLFLGLLRLGSKVLVRPVSVTADLSYGLYLFHVPVMFIVMPLVSPGGQWFLAGILLTLAVTYGIAWLSFHYVERPFMRWARGQGHARQPSASIPVTLAGKRA